jgi:asparagine synthase (glutamine-hydrolysing)
MCGIAGIVSSHHRDLGPLLEEMLGVMKHRGPDGAGYVIGEHYERQPSLEDIDFRNKKGTVALGHVRLAITGNHAGLQPFQSRDGRLSLLHNGEIYNYRSLAKEVGGIGLVTTGSDSEVLMRLFEKEYDGDLVAASNRVFPRLDGVYAIAITDRKNTVIARDRIGVRQLYYCEKRGIVAFASETKSLRALAGQDVQTHRLEPGHMMDVSPGESQVEAFWQPSELRSDELTDDPNRGIDRYDSAIKESIRKRISGRPRVGIIYSGGVDSFLIAYLVKLLGVPFSCYTAGRQGAPDIRWARDTAERFDFPLNVETLTTDDIEGLIPEVIQTIEDHSFNQVEVAIPVFASVRKAQENGELVILTGQGADELFGGYPWYPNIVLQKGFSEFTDRSWEDTLLLYKECLEREDKIAMAHSLELRVPFLDPEVIRTAFSIAPKLKIRSGGDTLGKRLHRAYCLTLGIPRDIALREKEAAQHGANVHNAFDELARRRGLTPELLGEAGYDPEQSVTEKLGSSSRYGYVYGRKDLWKPSPHVQFYLDCHAAELGMLSRPAQRHWADTMERLMSAGIEPIGSVTR